VIADNVGELELQGGEQIELMGDELPMSPAQEIATWRCNG